MTAGATAGEAAAPRAAFHQFERAFEDATAATGVRAERRIVLAGFDVLLRFASYELEGRMMRALQHLESDGAGEPALTVCAWDSASSGVALPFGPRTLDAYVRGGLPGASAGDDILMALGRPNPGLSMLDLRRGLGIYAVPDGRRLPHPDLSGPFVTIFSWWINRTRLVWTHAAAVGAGQSGVLIVGPGGSGKSTTSLACVRGGLDYVSDDYCIVDPDRLVAYSFSSGAKLALHAIDLLPDIAAHIVNPGSVERHKGIVYVSEVRPGQVKSSLTIGAIVFPGAKGASVPRLSRLGRAEALRALAPSSLVQLSAGTAPAIARMARMVRSVPSYRLDLPADLSLIPEAIRAISCGEVDD